MDVTVHEIHEGDIVFFEKDKFKDINLKIGDMICFHENGEIELKKNKLNDNNKMLFQSTEILRTKKRWWQLWKRKNITGYIFRVIKN